MPIRNIIIRKNLIQISFPKTYESLVKGQGSFFLVGWIIGQACMLIKAENNRTEVACCD